MNLVSDSQARSRMEKQGKSKNKFLKLLPRAATAVNFQNPPFSPGKDKRGDKFRWNQHGCKGFSGPIIKMIPDEARTKTKNGGEFETQEPTSPKVSCIGQIKQKKKMNKARRAEEKNRGAASRPDELKKQTSRIRRLFSGSTTKDRRKSDASKDGKVRVPDRGPPGLGQIRRFASSRDTFANFDWTAQIAPVDLDHREYPFSDEDRRDSDREEEEEEVIIPFSAPMAIGGGASKPRKEINLWKRRTMNPPIPLRLNSGES